MKLKYQTGVAAFVQFIVGTALGFANETYSSISVCIQHNHSSCVTNSFANIILAILTACWFGFVAILGYAAQDRRSRRLARFLMLAEAAVILVALFDITHFPDYLGLVTSIIDLAIALWVMLLAFRISHAKGGRVVASTKTRSRRRRHTI